MGKSSGLKPGQKAPASGQYLTIGPIRLDRHILWLTKRKINLGKLNLFMLNYKNAWQ
jgi:hypothetical protein